MTLFETLLLAHVAGDWLLQTEWEALNKGHNWRAMLYHVGTYHAVVLLVLLSRIGFQNISVYLITALLALSHAVLDRRWPVLWYMRTLILSVSGPPEKWLMIVVDQAIHVMLLGLTASIFA